MAVALAVSSTSLFFFQAEDGIRDLTVTGVQTCALPIYPTPKARLHAAHKRQRIRHRKAAGETRRRDTARQLEQRKRVPACLVDDPLTDPLVEPSWSRRGEQLACVGVRQSPQRKCRQPG